MRGERRTAEAVAFQVEQYVAGVQCQGFSPVNRSGFGLTEPDERLDARLAPGFGKSFEDFKLERKYGDEFRGCTFAFDLAGVKE